MQNERTRILLVNVFSSPYQKNYRNLLSYKTVFHNKTTEKMLIIKVQINTNNKLVLFKYFK